MFGHSWLEDNFLTIVCYDMTRVLEDNGWRQCLFSRTRRGTPKAFLLRKVGLHPMYTRF